MLAFAALLAVAAVPFARGSGGTAQIVTASDAGLRFVTLNGRVIRSLRIRPFDFAFSPDGSRIAFSDMDDFVGVMSVRGGRFERVGRGIDPSWSPDGTALVVQVNELCDDEGGLAVLRVGQSAPVFELQGEICGGEPDWSPGGGEIAFAHRDSSHPFSGRGPDSGIFVTDGTVTRQLTRDSNDTQPRWSPDGTRIAFLREGARARPSSLYVIDADGSHLRRLAAAPNLDVSDLDWSRDGAQLAVVLRTWAGRSGAAVVPASGGTPCLVSVAWNGPWSVRWAPRSAPGARRPARCRSFAPPRPRPVLQCSQAGARSAVDRSALPLWLRGVAHRPFGRLLPFCVDVDSDGDLDLVVVFDPGGSGGVVAWAVFLRTPSDWKQALIRTGTHMGVVAAGSDLVEVEPIYHRRDANCCPTEGVRHRLYRWRDGRLRLERIWRTAD
ncbi:MAG: TolB protein [Gaiellaceae bacterium]|jgi:hypothetical protein|nr:TolB protein [Gaiellaceae bacterium]